MFFDVEGEHAFVRKRFGSSYDDSRRKLRELTGLVRLEERLRRGDVRPCIAIRAECMPRWRGVSAVEVRRC